MLKKIIYTVVVIVIAVIALVVGLEVFSSYPNDAIVYNTNAPVKAIKTITIHADPEKVWGILSDVNKWESWESDIKNPVLHGDFTVGNSFTWKTKGLSIRSNIKVANKFTEIAWSGPSIGVFAIHTWTFTPIPGGYTKVDIRESMQGWLAELITKKMREGLDVSLDKWLLELKTEAEKK